MSVVTIFIIVVYFCCDKLDKSKQEIMQYYFGDRKMADLQKNCIAIAFRMDGKKSETHSFFNKVGLFVLCVL